jgi:glucosamine--fructose-6-phosphate aminotransferase (isomerizing)
MGLFGNKKTSMEQEIFEQSGILDGLLKAHISEDNEIDLEVPQGIAKVVLVASGSSYHCARYAADLFGKLAGIEARAMYSSEFLLKAEVPRASDILYVFVTQSGETSDTNKALNRAKEFGMRTFAVTNKKDSTIWQAADYKINCRAGEEKSIAATKTMTSQMLALTLLVLRFAQLKPPLLKGGGPRSGGGISDVDEIIDQLKLLPEQIQHTFDLRPQIKKLAGFLARYKSIVVSADGISYALAKEAALKIKETSYINANAIILGEFMHGHLAVLNKKYPLVYIETGDLSYTAIKNLNKITADYKTPLCIIGNANEKVQAKFNINVNCENEIVKSLCIVVIEQLLALETAGRLGRNVDKPKGLEKVVV